jgi:broad specificity phosphatase PhoE
VTRPLAVALALALALAWPATAGPGEETSADRAPAVATADAPVRPTIVILVRHAEKNEHPPGGDAGLTTRGIVRAQTLVRVLQDAGVSAVFASQYGRARLTAAPLASALGDSVHVYDANDLAALARKIQDEYAGRTVVVVGHGDSIPLTITALGGPPLAKGEGVDYDRLFVLTIAPGVEPRLVRLRYGDVSR